MANMRKVSFLCKPILLIFLGVSLALEALAYDPTFYLTYPNVLVSNQENMERDSRVDGDEVSFFGVNLYDSHLRIRRADAPRMQSIVAFSLLGQAIGAPTIPAYPYFLTWDNQLTITTIEPAVGEPSRPPDKLDGNELGDHFVNLLLLAATNRNYPSHFTRAMDIGWVMGGFRLFPQWRGFGARGPHSSDYDVNHFFRFFDPYLGMLDDPVEIEAFAHKVNTAISRLESVLRTALGRFYASFLGLNVHRMDPEFFEERIRSLRSKAIHYFESRRASPVIIDGIREPSSKPILVRLPAVDIGEDPSSTDAGAPAAEKLWRIFFSPPAQRDAYLGLLESELGTIRPKVVSVLASQAAAESREHPYFVGPGFGRRIQMHLNPESPETLVVIQGDPIEPDREGVLLARAMALRAGAHVLPVSSELPAASLGHRIREKAAEVGATRILRVGLGARAELDSVFSDGHFSYFPIRGRKKLHFLRKLAVALGYQLDLAETVILLRDTNPASVPKLLGHRSIDDLEPEIEQVLAPDFCEAVLRRNLHPRLESEGELRQRSAS